MSIDYYATALIGCKIPRDMLYKQERLRGCGHDLDDRMLETFAYCPICGSPIWKVSEQRLFDEEWDLDGLSIVSSTDNREWFVGYLVVTSRDRKDDKCCKIDFRDHTIVDIRSIVKDVLDKYNAWDENSFGMWAVPYISY